MIGRSIWGQAKKEFGKIDDKKLKLKWLKILLIFMEKILLKKVHLLMG